MLGAEPPRPFRHHGKVASSSAIRRAASRGSDAPVIGREVETVSFGEDLYGPPLPIPAGERSLAEVEGLGEWDHRHETKPQHPADLSLDEKRAKARALRNPRDWEKK